MKVATSIRKAVPPILMGAALVVVFLLVASQGVSNTQMMLKRTFLGHPGVENNGGSDHAAPAAAARGVGRGEYSSSTAANPSPRSPPLLSSSAAATTTGGRPSPSPSPLVIAVGVSGGPRSMMITAGRIHDNVLRALVGCFPAALGDPCPALANVDVYLDLNRENDCDANPNNAPHVPSCSRAHAASIARLDALVAELCSGDPTYPVQLLTAEANVIANSHLETDSDTGPLGSTASIATEEGRIKSRNGRTSHRHTTSRILSPHNATRLLHNATLVAFEDAPFSCQQHGAPAWNATSPPSVPVTAFLEGDVCCIKHPKALEPNGKEGGLWGFGQYARRRRLIQLILRHEPARLAFRGKGPHSNTSPTVAASSASTTRHLYAVIVLIRPDYFIFRPLPPLTSLQRTNPGEVLLSSKEVGGGILGDYIYVVPRRRLEVLDWAITATFSQRCEAHVRLDGTPEAELLQWLQRRRVPFVRFQFYGAIVASPTYNSCWRLNTAVLEGSMIPLLNHAPPPPPQPPQQHEHRSLPAVGAAALTKPLQQPAVEVTTTTTGERIEGAPHSPELPPSTNAPSSLTEDVIGTAVEACKLLVDAEFRRKVGSKNLMIPSGR